MLNKGPIFINAFSRGGSNMMVNFILSSPEICISAGETHKVFKPGSRFDKGLISLKKRVFYDYPIRLAVGQDYFFPNLVKPRKNVPEYIRKFIDRLLYEGRFKARLPSHNLYKAEGIEYTDEELSECRLLTKGLNGIVFTVDMFKEMYPDATFLALVRNGLAVCEGRSRRGHPITKFAEHYQTIVDRMLELEQQLPNYHIFRYEDMVTKPLDFMHQIYEKANIDMSKVQKVRLESKATIDAQGNHVLSKGHDREVFWYEKDQLGDHIKPNINENQINKLPQSVRDAFLKIAGNAMEKLNYPTDTPITP